MAAPRTVPRQRPVGHTAAAPPAPGEVHPAPIAHRPGPRNCTATLPLGPSPWPTIDRIHRGRMAGLFTRIGRSTRISDASCPVAAISTAPCGADPICTARTIRGTRVRMRMTALRLRITSAAVLTRKDSKSISAPVYRSGEPLGPRAYHPKPGRGDVVVRNLHLDHPYAAGAAIPDSGFYNGDRHLRTHGIAVPRSAQCPARLRGLPA